MEQEVNLEVIKTTQTTLGKHLKKPPLTEKLLRKPPFRFIHDIVTSVLKSTGFFEGLFDENELISDNVKDRESKIAFLNKVVTVLVSTTGKSIAVKPSKVVAGQEPEKTNELLQMLAEALDRNLSSKEAVLKFRNKSTKSNDKTDKPKDVKVLEKTKKISSEKKLTARSSEKLTTQKKETISNKNDKIKQNSNAKPKEKEAKGDLKENSQKDEPQKKTVSQSKTINKKSDKLLQKEKPLESNNSTTNIAAAFKQVVSKNSNSDVLEKVIQKESFEQIEKESAEQIEESADSPRNVQVQLNTSYTIAEKDLNSSASSRELETNELLEDNQQEDIQSNALAESIDKDNKDANELKHSKIADAFINNIQSKESKNDERSPSKELKKSNSEDAPSTQVVNESYKVRPQSMRPSSSRPGAPRVRDKHENSIAVDSNMLVGKVNIITENTPNEEEEDTSIIIVDQKVEEETAESLQLSSNPRGHLVQQILESQKEYSQTGKTEIEWQFGAHRAREALNQEVDQIRFNIQALSRVANPLGKLLDHIQEDVEVMRQELQQWQQSYEEASKLLNKQKLVNDDSLQPHRTKVKQLEADIKEKHEKINDLKVVIHKNALRIDKLLASGHVQ